MSHGLNWAQFQLNKNKDKKKNERANERNEMTVIVFPLLFSVSLPSLDLFSTHTHTYKQLLVDIFNF